MRTEHLAYLLEVARCKSISEAAQKLYVGQTTLSAIISSIESELNIKIFQRSYQGIRITPQGEQAMTMIESIVNQESALHEIFRGSSRARKVAHLLAYPSGCGALCMPLLRAVGERHPDISLVFHETPYSATIQKVVAGTAKIAVGADAASSIFSRQQEAQEADLCFEELFQDSFCLAVSADSPFAKRQSVPLPELYGEHLAAAQFYPLTANSPIARTFKSFPHFTVFTNTELIKKAIAQGGMVGIIPRLGLLDDIYVTAGRICLAPLEGFPETLINFLAYQKKGLSAAERTILEEIRAFFQALSL
ncbi:MAG: LysR family transcriptional regulator [Oscillibacter sp.]|jgi:DNA-binding transcriptional LysR family regulator|nr:LysR family transcriptional regulator [Oscillibacter sp.]